MTTQTRRFSVSDGLTLVGDVGGDPAAPPVILLHGGGQTRHSWGLAMEVLVNAGYHVLNLDARGHGESDWSADGDYSIATLAADLSAVIETLAAPPALIGASMGGATSLFYTGHADQSRVRALVLVDIVPKINAVGAKRIRAFMRAYPEGFASLEEAANAVSDFYPERPRPRDSNGLMKNLRRREDGRFHWHWDPRFVESPERAEPPQFAHKLQQAARGVRQPVLLVQGMSSDIVSTEGVADLQQQIPHLEVYEVANAGHMVAGDKNDAFNEGIIRFLQCCHPPLAAAKIRQD
ncbi:alpha/beta fold hydrolase [Sinimarinibacterium flocculans]|uniref:alpha/beta fold hydrolase n=1 Tax=Sinimarinibacterium flocculans TaxID=985250 RepID=UPI00249090A3|nr:alpha/beta hydrolase [Sinimarinibacterium flocculans]